MNDEIWMTRASEQAEPPADCRYIWLLADGDVPDPAMADKLLSLIGGHDAIWPQISSQGFVPTLPQILSLETYPQLLVSEPTGALPLQVFLKRDCWHSDLRRSPLAQYRLWEKNSCAKVTLVTGITQNLIREDQRAGFVPQWLELRRALQLSPGMAAVDPLREPKILELARAVSDVHGDDFGQWLRRYPFHGVVDCAGIQLLCQNDDQRALAYFWNLHKDEQEVIDRWLKEVSGSQTVVDIGAGTGFYSLLAAKAGRRVLAFEALSNAFQRLRENIALNQWSDKIEARCLLAADKRHPVSLHLAMDFDLIADGDAIRNGEEDGITNLEAGEGLLLDGLMARTEVNKIDVIRVHQRTFELKALKGLQERLQSDRPTIFLPNPYLPLVEELTGYLASLGYGEPEAIGKSLWYVASNGGEV